MQRKKLYGGEFQPNNPNNPRTIIAGWVVPHSRVLEIGPGEGVIGNWLKNEKDCHVAGVEFVSEAARAISQTFDAVIEGSIEDPSVQSQIDVLPRFDAVIFADVLEHLVNPWNVLRVTRRWLSPQGRVLISVPNIAHWIARFNLLRGNWDYTDGFLMDKTHLRWFTRRTAQEMAHTSGYVVEECAAIFKPRFARLWPSLMGYQTVMKIAPVTKYD